MQEKRAFYVLDGMRGIAAILIIFHHIPHYFIGSFSRPEAFLAVDLFFMLSGVVLANAYEQRLLTNLSVWQFLKIRLIRLYPLYILGTFIGFFTLYQARNDFSEFPDIFDHHWQILGLAVFLIPNVFSFAGPYIFPLDGVTWSLFFEVVINWIYAGTIKILAGKKLLFVIGFSALMSIAVVCFAPHHSVGFGWSKKGLPFGIVRVAMSYFYGVLLYRIYSKYRHFKIEGVIPAVLILSAIAITLMTAPPKPLQAAYSFLAILVIFPSLIFAALFLREAQYVDKTCRFLGLISYAVYCLHAPTGKLLDNFLLGKGFSVANYAPYSGVAFLGVFIFTCWLLDRMYDFPVRKLLTKHFVR